EEKERFMPGQRPPEDHPSAGCRTQLLSTAQSLFLSERSGRKNAKHAYRAVDVTSHAARDNPSAITAGACAMVVSAAVANATRPMPPSTAPMALRSALRLPSFFWDQGEAVRQNGRKR